MAFFMQACARSQRSTWSTSSDPSKTSSHIADVSELGPAEKQVCLLEVHLYRSKAESMPRE
jgi:hypothetical protein